MVTSLYIFCLNRLHSKSGTPIVIEKIVEEGFEDDKDVETDNQCSFCGLGEGRFWYILFIIFFGIEPVDFSNRIAKDN